MRKAAEGEEKPYYNSAEPLVPKTTNLRSIAEAAKACRACHLWRHGTQTVFGEGATHPEIMLVGEQPGDKEDVEGHPFVGPAGRVLNESLAQAGIDPKRVYITNAVKHFKWEPRGQRRLHKKPNRAEMGACRPWLEAEIRVLQPQIIVCLGSTAAQSVIGPGIKVTEKRGQFMSSILGPEVMVTVHPSSLLRVPDHDKRIEEREKFVSDLKKVAERLALRHRRSA